LRQTTGALERDNGKLKRRVQLLKDRQEALTHMLEERNEYHKSAMESQTRLLDTLAGELERVTKLNDELTLTVIRLQSQIDDAHLNTATVTARFDDGKADDLLAELRRTVQRNVPESPDHDERKEEQAESIEPEVATCHSRAPWSRLWPRRRSSAD
jgi:hypothetical protein